MVDEHAWSDEDMLTVAQAAVYRGVAEPTIRRWIKQGLLPGYRTHTGLRRVKFADLRDTERMIPDEPQPHGDSEAGAA